MDTGGICLKIILLQGNIKTQLVNFTATYSKEFKNKKRKRMVMYCIRIKI